VALNTITLAMQWFCGFFPSFLLFFLFFCYAMLRTNNSLQSHSHKTKDWATRTPLKNGNELRCSGRVSSSCSTSGTHHVTLVTNLVITHEWGKNDFNYIWDNSILLDILTCFTATIFWGDYTEMTCLNNTRFYLVWYWNNIRL
jgi:hypothetical protein